MMRKTRAGSAAHADRPFLRRRLRAARRRLADLQNLFERTVLLAPYLGYDAPTNRPHSGGWANADVPRFLALMALRRSASTAATRLPVLAFAVPPNSEKILTATYSYRLMRNFATRGYRRDLAAATAAR